MLMPGWDTEIVAVRHPAVIDLHDPRAANDVKANG